MDHYHQACHSLNTNLARYPALAVGLPLIGGFLSALPAQGQMKSYYEALAKPDWAPPSSVFGPAWAALYLSLGYASHLVALRTGPNTLPSVRSLAQSGLGIYGLNLILNFAWSPLMFKHKKIGAALITAGGLSASSLALAYNFFKVDKLAGYLTIPYVLWLGYATALNYDVWIKNSGGDAASHARKIGKDINNAAKNVKDDAKDAARTANKNARGAANDASEKLDKELR